MSRFDRFADRVADIWAKGWWFMLCLGFVVGWVIGLVARGEWNNDVYHLWLNTPTTALTFLGVFLQHNDQHRFEKATNQRLHEIQEQLNGDAITDEGQRP